MKRYKHVSPAFFSMHLQVYPFIIRFSVNQSFEQLCEEDQIDTTDDYTVALLQSCTTPGRVIPFEDNVYLVVIRGFDFSPDAFGVVAHEITHIVNFVFKRIGHKPDVDNDEPECYLTQYITNQFFEGIGA